MHSVLFVCSANVCRSPMAEGLMKALVRQKGETWRIESAGVWALNRSPAVENTLQVLRLRGIDLSRHISRQITFEMAEEFNLILTMESNHQEALQAAFPELAENVFMLSEMIGKTVNVADPIGFPLVVFEQTAREIELILDRGYARIACLAQKVQDAGS